MQGIISFLMKQFGAHYYNAVKIDFQIYTGTHKNSSSPENKNLLVLINKNRF